MANMITKCLILLIFLAAVSVAKSVRVQIIVTKNSTSVDEIDSLAVVPLDTTTETSSVTTEKIAFPCIHAMLSEETVVEEIPRKEASTERSFKSFSFLNVFKYNTEKDNWANTFSKFLAANKTSATSNDSHLLSTATMSTPLIMNRFSLPLLEDNNSSTSGMSTTTYKNPTTQSTPTTVSTTHATTKLAVSSLTTQVPASSSTTKITAATIRSTEMKAITSTTQVPVSDSTTKSTTPAASLTTKTAVTGSTTQMPTQMLSTQAYSSTSTQSMGSTEATQTSISTESIPSSLIKSSLDQLLSEIYDESNLTEGLDVKSERIERNPLIEYMLVRPWNASNTSTELFMVNRTYTQTPFVNLAQLPTQRIEARSTAQTVATERTYWDLMPEFDVTSTTIQKTQPATSTPMVSSTSTMPTITTDSTMAVADTTVAYNLSSTTVKDSSTTPKMVSTPTSVGTSTAGYQFGKLGLLKRILAAQYLMDTETTTAVYKRTTPTNADEKFVMWEGVLRKPL